MKSGMYLLEDFDMKKSSMLTVALFVAMSVYLMGCEKWHLDDEVRQLCAKDGGIKVYETVRLPAEKFNQWGQINFYDPTQGDNTLGSDYLFKHEIHYYRRGNPEMSREHYQILRRSDGKLLGETILYGRGGGDIPGPWHDSSFSCPEPLEAGPNALLKNVFLHQMGGEK